MKTVILVLVAITAAAADCPPPLFGQLAEGGVLVIPVGDRESQILQAIRKEGGLPRVVDLSSCRFVPLVGLEGWPDSGTNPDPLV